MRKKAAIAHIVPCRSFTAAVLRRENPAFDAKDAPEEARKFRKTDCERRKYNAGFASDRLPSRIPM